MSIELRIQPRNTGKTTELQKESIKKKGSKSLFLSAHRDEYDCATTEELINSTHISHILKDIDTLYIDDYFDTSFTFKELIFKNYKSFNIKAIGTPVERYDEDTVRLIKFWWIAKLENAPTVDILISESKMIEKYGRNLLYNLLVHPDCNVIKWNSNMKNILSPEQYEMEILGNIYK